MFNYNTIKNKKIALLILNAQKENDAHVYLGEIKRKEGGYYFVNKEKGWLIPLEDEWLSRLKIVKEDLKPTLLGADYVFSLLMGDLPDDGEGNTVKTGINWNDNH